MVLIWRSLGAETIAIAIARFGMLDRSKPHAPEKPDRTMATETKDETEPPKQD